MKRLGLLGVFLAIAGLALAQVARAEDDRSREVSNLGQVVITATKTPKKLENVPATVTIIGPEEIEAMPARTVGDLLADLPGVQAKEPQGVGLVTPQSVRMRGIGFAGHTLVMLDGQPINNAFTDFPYMTTIPLRAVERVEVIRGPFSALYGSSAGGGVINIITRDGGEEPYAEIFGQKGNFGRSDYGTSVGIVHENLSLGLFYDHKDVDNYKLYDDKDLDDTNLDYEHDRFHGKLTGTLGDKTSFSVSGGAIDGKTGFGLSDNLSIENCQNVERPYLNLQLNSHLTKKLELLAQANWQSSEHEYHGETLENVTFGFGPPIFNYKPSINLTESDRYRGDVTLNYSFNPDHILTVGSEVIYTEVEKSIRHRDTGELLDVQGRPGEKLDKDDTSYSFYTQYDAMFLDRFELVLGVRYDDFETYGSEWSPKATIRWHYKDTGNLKLSAGKGFKAPNLNQLYTTPWSIGPTIVYTGNEDLEAETLWSYELSLEQYVFENRLFFRLSPYYSKAKDFITSVRETDPLNPAGQIMYPDNVEKVEIKGVDLELSYKPWHFLTLFANYNYNETRDENTDEILDGYPRNSAAIGARSRYALTDDWTLLGYYSIRYSDDWTTTSWGRPPVTEEVGDYWLHSASFGVSWKDMVNLKVDGFNLFNDRTETGIDSYLSERNFLVELSLKYTF